MKGFDYRIQKPVQFTGRELGKLKREHVAAGGQVNQVTTPQGKEVWFRGRNKATNSTELQLEVYL